ncbi:hypothetical protein GCM10010458_28520 [Microbacterium luteolum]
MSLLGKIIRVVDDGETHATPGMLMVDPGDAAERASVTADARALRDQQQVNLDERYSGGWAARPTSDGRDAWAEYVARRSDPVERQRQARNDYLRWIYEHTRDNTLAVADHFLEAGLTFLGDPYAMEDLTRAGKWLADRGLIEGPGADQRPDPLRVGLTVKGEDLVESGRELHSEAPQAASTSYTFHAPAQVAHNSPNVVQMQTNDASKGAVEIAAMLDQLTAILVPDEARRTGEFAAQLREEASGTARSSRFREIGDAVMKAFGTGLGGALGSAVSTHTNAWLGTLV